MNEPTQEDILTRVATLLQQAGRPQDGKALQRKLSEPAKGKPILLVVGEDKRGKSSLTNALLGIPDASPVGVGVVTGAPLTFFWSATPKASVYRYGSTTAEPMEVNDARDLATVMGNPGNIENVRSVRIGVDLPLLNEVTLVDTPGVGGLSSGHGTLTMQSLRRADALVFVLDAGAQIRASELEFLVRAAERVETVIIAVTKIDAHRGWRTIVDDTKAILTAQAPRFASAPVVPVSNSLAFQGLRAKDPEDAADLRAESGIPALEAVIREQVTARVALARRSNLLRAASTALVPIQRMLEEQLADEGDPQGHRQRLEAERERLKDLTDDRARWPQQLDSEMRKIGLDRSDATSRHIAALRHSYDQRLRKVSKADQESLPGELVADLAALEGELNEDAAKRLRDLVVSIVDELDADTDAARSLDQITEGRLADTLGSLALGEHTLSMTDRLSVLSYFSRGRSLGSLLSGSGLGLSAGAFLTPPIGLVIGFGVGAAFAVGAFKNRGTASFVTEFRSWMSEQISSAQVTLGNGWSRQAIDLQIAIREAVRDVLLAREGEIAASVAALTEQLEAETGDREKIRALAQHRNGVVKAMQADVLHELETLVRALPGGTPASTGGGG